MRAERRGARWAVQLRNDGRDFLPARGRRLLRAPRARPPRRLEGAAAPRGRARAPRRGLAASLVHRDRRCGRTLAGVGRGPRPPRLRLPRGAPSPAGALRMAPRAADGGRGSQAREGRRGPPSLHPHRRPRPALRPQHGRRRPPHRNRGAHRGARLRPPGDARHAPRRTRARVGAALRGGELGRGGWHGGGGAGARLAFARPPHPARRAGPHPQLGGGARGRDSSARATGRLRYRCAWVSPTRRPRTP